MTSHRNKKGEIFEDSKGNTRGILQSYEGPLPHPDLMEKYEKIQQGAANRILSMAEKEQEHRHTIDNQILEDRKQERDTQMTGFKVGVGVVVFIVLVSAYLIYMNKTTEGVVALIAAISPYLIAVLKTKK